MDKRGCEMYLYNYFVDKNYQVSQEDFIKIKCYMWEKLKFDILNLRYINFDWGYDITHNDILMVLSLIYYNGVNFYENELTKKETQVFFKRYKRLLKEHYKNEMFETNLSLDELFRNEFDTQMAYFDKTERKVMRHYLVLGYLAHIAYVFGEAELSDVGIEEVA